MKQFFITQEKFTTGNTPCAWWSFIFNDKTQAYEKHERTLIQDPIEAFEKLAPAIEKKLNITIYKFKPSYIL